MTRLNRYVLKRIATPALIALAVTCFVGVANELRERVDEAPLAQVRIEDMLRLSLYFMPTLISYVVPVTFMLGILMAFGRLSQDGEIVAMKAGGIPLKRVIVPVVIVGAVLSIASLLIQDSVQPWAAGRVQQLIYSELPMRLSLDALPAGVMHDFRGLRVYFAERDDSTGALREIHVREPRSDGVWVYHAEQARLEETPDGSKLEMTNAHVIPPIEQDEAEIKHGAYMHSKRFILELPEPVAERIRSSRRALSVKELLHRQRRLQSSLSETSSPLTAQNLYKTQQEIADRLSLPFASLAVAFVAAPLGARARRGGRSYTFGVGLAIVGVYYVLQMLVAPRSLHALPLVVLRSWTPNLMLCLTGLYLLWRVDRV